MVWRAEALIDGRRLITESEAFLVGRYADHLMSRGRDVPVWAWTNVLAHGSGALLHELATSIGAPGTSARAIWIQARGYLAGEVLGAATNGSLTAVQRHTLVPLELELASSPGVASWSPRQWVCTVLQSISSSSRTSERRIDH